jgi:hypothetical protein
VRVSLRPPGPAAAGAMPVKMPVKIYPWASFTRFTRRARGGRTHLRPAAMRHAPAAWPALLRAPTPAGPTEAVWPGSCSCSAPHTPLSTMRVASCAVALVLLPVAAWALPASPNATGFICEKTLKKCEASKTSKLTLHECERNCDKAPNITGYICEKHLKKCERSTASKLTLPECEKDCGGHPAPHPPPHSKECYVCNTETNKCEKGDYKPCFQTESKCEDECKPPPSYVCVAPNPKRPTEKRCELAKEGQHGTPRATCETECKKEPPKPPRPTHGYICNRTIHRCEASKIGKGSMQTCEKTCKAEPTKFVCKQASKTCEKSENGTLSHSACKEHCKDPTPPPAPPAPPPTPEGYACDTTAKKCVLSKESKKSAAECAAVCK